MIKRIHRWGEKPDRLYDHVDENVMEKQVNLKFLRMFHVDDSRMADALHNVRSSIKRSL